MTRPALHDLVVRAAAVDNAALAGWMLGNDRYARRLDEAGRTSLVAAALSDGDVLAGTVRTDAVSDLAAQLGISIAHDDGEIAIAGHIFSADYRPDPPRIRFYTRATAAIDRGLAAPGVAEIVGTKRSMPVLLAHEVYHHLDLARACPLTRRHQVVSMKLGPWHLKTELPSLAEIAAGRFAATLLGLDCHPKLLDLLLLWDSDPRRAAAWTDALEAFDRTLARKETV